jgi:hypothetical protein
MDITLAIILFLTIFSFLSWLTRPIAVVPQSTIGAKPIERQLKEVFETIDEQETKSVVSVTDFQEPPIVETSPTTKQVAKTKAEKVSETTIKEIPAHIDLGQIKLQEARQIANSSLSTLATEFWIAQLGSVFKFFAISYCTATLTASSMSMSLPCLSTMKSGVR